MKQNLVVNGGSFGVQIALRLIAAVERLVKIMVVIQAAAVGIRSTGQFMDVALEMPMSQAAKCAAVGELLMEDQIWHVVVPTPITSTIKSVAVELWLVQVLI